jgi:hypothetical protein
MEAFIDPRDPRGRNSAVVSTLEPDASIAAPSTR